jgi:hypothetical protein
MYNGFALIEKRYHRFAVKTWMPVKIKNSFCICKIKFQLFQFMIQKKEIPQV